MVPRTKNTLTAAVLVFNSRKTIERCIQSLSFCDEIVVVDDCSTDGTWEYLQSLQDSVVSAQHLHDTFSLQRQYAKDLAHGRWLLTMDADEYITKDLAKAIRKAIDNPNAPDGFILKRHNPYPLGLKGHEWTKHPRLVRRDICKWKSTDSPHAPLDRRGLKFKNLKGGFIEHEPIGSYPAALRKTINRALIVAEQMKNRSRKASMLHMCLSCLSRFIKTYFFHGAIRFGRSGFLYSLLISFEAFCKYSFLFSSKENNLMRLTDGGLGSYPEKK